MSTTALIHNNSKTTIFTPIKVMNGRLVTFPRILLWRSTDHYEANVTSSNPIARESSGKQYKFHKDPPRKYIYSSLSQSCLFNRCVGHACTGKACLCFLLGIDQGSKIKLK
jgi:hypothetical protein